MKHFIYITLIILFLFSCKGKDGYVIEGQFSGLQSLTLYVVTPSSKDSGVEIDTVQSDKNGGFLYHGNSEKPVPVIIYMEDGNVWTTAWAQNNDKITMSGDARNPELIVAKGGKINDLITDFKVKNKDLLTEKWNLTYKYSSSKTDSLNANPNQTEYKSKLSNIDHQLKEQVEEFIKQHPSSAASLVLLQDYLVDMGNPQLIQEYLLKITGDVTQSPLYQKLTNLNSRIQKTIPGATAPDFTVIDTQKDTIHLNSFKGKYFLLTFSASWCEMCDKYNEDLSDLRKKRNKDKLEMLTISLDEDSSAWIKKLKESNLSWNQAIDTHGWNSEMVSLYNITEIPSNLLIDKTSIIVGKNLSTDSIMKIVN